MTQVVDLFLGEDTLRWFQFDVRAFQPLENELQMLQVLFKRPREADDVIYEAVTKFAYVSGQDVGHEALVCGRASAEAHGHLVVLI